MQEAVREWTCPWCRALATLPGSASICQSRRCECGALAIAAPPWDTDEIIDDAIGVFGIGVAHLTSLDSDRVTGLRQMGVDVAEGQRLPATGSDRFELRVLWFRRRAEAGACVFCEILRSEPTPGVVAFRDAHTAVFPSLHQQPRNRGHVLVATVRHVAQIYDVDHELASPLMTTLVRVAAAVKTTWRADGVTVRQNNERHGGQDIFHLHFHVIPRFADDGFDRGPDRFPYGAVEVPLSERIAQAARLSDVLRQTSRHV
jgi:histidine triad (HIT) family protein